MSTAKIIAELRQLLAHATGGRWFVTYTPAKEPRIETTQQVGQVTLASVVVPASFTMRHEDAELIVALHERIEGLMAAVEAKEAERIAAVIAMERAQNEHMETMRKAIAAACDTKADMVQAIGTANEINAIADRVQKDLAAARAQLVLQEPLVAELERWARTRHSPRLMAAWDRYLARRKV